MCEGSPGKPSPDWPPWGLKAFLCSVHSSCPHSPALPASPSFSTPSSLATMPGSRRGRTGGLLVEPVSLFNKNLSPFACARGNTQSEQSQGWSRFPAPRSSTGVHPKLHQGQVRNPAVVKCLWWWSRSSKMTSDDSKMFVESKLFPCTFYQLICSLELIELVQSFLHLSTAPQVLKLSMSNPLEPVSSEFQHTSSADSSS